jgi:Secretion system C-terminal sorting domain
MKRLLPLIFFFIVNSVSSQTVSIRLVETAYSAVDPDGAGPATGSVTIQFELMTSSGSIDGDGVGLSFVYQSAMLMPTPTNTTVAEGPIASASAWVQGVDNRTGTDVSVMYGAQTFDKRMIITFNQSSGLDNATFPNTWTPVAQVTYWTLGSTMPEGGYATPEDGATVPQNSLSADGGLTSYDFLSPGLNTPIPLGSGTVPVLFTKFDAGCTKDGANVSWSTASEFNSNYFELQRSTNGSDWISVATVKAAGTSSASHTYQLPDFTGGKAFYRIRQVDVDGHSIYTSVIRSNCEFSPLDMVLYPVPARDLLNVVIRSDKSLKTQLLLLDASGKTVRKIDVTLFNGSNTFLVNLKGLSAGQYIIRSNGSDIQLTKTFNVVR